YDAENQLLGTQDLTVPADCSWTWHGWSFSVPVGRVRIIGNYSGGGYVQMDDMEANFGGGGGGCYPNCDGSTGAPCLNVLDFNCFLNQFAAGAPYANCDQSTTPPVLNVLDFNCFLNQFAAGCTGC